MLRLSLLQRQPPLSCAVIFIIRGLLSLVSTGLPASREPLRSPVEDLVSSFMGYDTLKQFLL